MTATPFTLAVAVDAAATVLTPTGTRPRLARPAFLQQAGANGKIVHLKVGAEVMQLTRVTPSGDLEVVRAVNGTTAVAHDAGALLDVYTRKSGTIWRGPDGTFNDRNAGTTGG